MQCKYIKSWVFMTKLKFLSSYTNALLITENKFNVILGVNRPWYKSYV